MIRADHIRADVFDIRAGMGDTPESLVVDANVLYWMFYPNFLALKAAGGHAPQPYQTNYYPRFWRSAAQNNCEFFTVGTTIGEFAKLAEFAEIESLWLLDPAKPGQRRVGEGFSPSVCKFCRYQYSNQLSGIRQNIEAVLSGILGSVALLHQFPSPNAEYQSANGAWLSSMGDFPDAVLVAAAIEQGQQNILSDDSDLATFDGLTVYTANDRTVSAARDAGRLVN